MASRAAIPAELLLTFRQLADTGRTYRDFGCPQANPKVGHPDGWGIGAIGLEGEIYTRGFAKASSDPKYEDAVRRLGREVTPPVLLLAHVRRASVRDSIQEQFSHPFRKEVDGRVVFFAHNGEIEGFGVRAGKIDTQEIFDRFLESLGAEQPPLPEFKQAIAKAKEGLDRDFHRKIESLTFLMIDGDRIVAHRDARSCIPYYTLHTTVTDTMSVVCSEVLPNLPGRWRMLRNGEFTEYRASIGAAR